MTEEFLNRFRLLIQQNIEQLDNLIKNWQEKDGSSIEFYKGKRAGLMQLENLLMYLKDKNV